MYQRNNNMFPLKYSIDWSIIIGNVVSEKNYYPNDFFRLKGLNIVKYTFRKTFTSITNKLLKSEFKKVISG